MFSTSAPRFAPAFAVLRRGEQRKRLQNQSRKFLKFVATPKSRLFTN
jgi:hypothetical protein